MKRFKPGKLSNQLREALGLRKDEIPPWIINMQKFGLPPSYPNYQTPGLMRNFETSLLKTEKHEEENQF